MLSSLFAEDLFVEFYRLVDGGKFVVQHQDFSPIVSFYTRIAKGEDLTKSQADFILKILEKYKNLSVVAGLDYRNDLANIAWRNPFRVLDLSKKIYIEKGKKDKLEICLKFPYQLKKEFDEEINVNLNGSHRVSHWDDEVKVRRLNFYEFNLITLYEFALKHQFEIDDSFMNVLADVEEIWQNAESIEPYSEITTEGVELKNASSETQEWWEHNRTGSFDQDVLLAKSMGFPLKKIPESLIEKIGSSRENNFWLKNNQDLFAISQSLKGKICVILDRQGDTLNWLQRFVADADKNKISRDEIKVCFRDSKDSNTGINDWIKTAGVGGKVETGKYLIFESKPAKWLFKENQDAIMLITNNIYPPTNTMAKDWFQSHPCVIYLGDTMPTKQRGRTIVEL